MSCAIVLRARVEEISLAIEQQNQVLRDLETRLSDARRELNAALDPTARLPLELSSHIFARCIPSSPRPRTREAPMLFLNICRIWRDIATSTPTLWTSLSCRSPDPTNLELWLGRAKNLPLSVPTYGKFTQDAAIVVQQHAHHLKTLKLDLQQLKRLAAPTLPFFPFLAKLVVKASDERQPTSRREFLDILRAAPALVDCDFMPALWYDLPTEEFRSPTPLTHSSCGVSHWAYVHGAK